MMKNAGRRVGALCLLSTVAVSLNPALAADRAATQGDRVAHGDTRTVAVDVEDVEYVPTIAADSGGAAPTTSVRGAGGTEFVRFTLGNVVWGAADGLPATLARHGTYRATFNVLLTTPVARRRVVVRGYGLHASHCTELRLEVGKPTSFSCTIEVVAHAGASVTLSAAVRSSDHEYRTAWQHSVSQPVRRP